MTAANPRMDRPRWTRRTPLICLFLAAVVPAPAIGGQLPPGYSLEPVVPLPDTLHEVYSGGAYRITIERGAGNAFERRLIEDAERLFPPRASIDSVAAREAKVRNAAAFARAAERPGPRWWYYEKGGTWIPYVLTAGAVAHVVDRVRELSREPVPSYYQPGWNHTVHATYAAAVERMPAPGVAYRVRLTLDFFIDCGGRCGYGFQPARSVDFDEGGYVIAVSGDGRIIERYR